MIVLRQAQVEAIRTHASEAYPDEACGLLVGRRDGDRREVLRVEPSANLADEPRHRFEIDPALRFRLMRALRDSGEDILGHYHSHPDGPSAPSATDLAMAYEPDLVWLILGVSQGQPGRLTAHLADPDGGIFHNLALRIRR